MHEFLCSNKLPMLCSVIISSISCTCLHTPCHVVYFSVYFSQQSSLHFAWLLPSTGRSSTPLTLHLFSSLAPKYLAELCVPVADVAGRRQLRSASRGLLNFPRYNVSNYGLRAFCFTGPYVWNSLPEHIRQSTSIAVFKRSLKTFLLQQISHLAH